MSEGMVVDLGSVPSLEAIPEGFYVCEISAAVAKPSSTGKPMLRMSYVITEGDLQGRKITGDNWIFVGDAAMYTKARIKNVAPDLLTFVGELAELGELLIGRACRVKVNHREWEGEMRSNAAGVYALDAASGSTGTPNIF